MFLFTPCQVGAETTLKKEIRRLFPEYRAAFGRPGFVTFKVPDDEMDPDDVVFELAERSVFTRSAALSIGRIDADDIKQIAEETWRIAEENGRYVNRIHVYSRDPFPPGERGFEPGLTPENRELHHAIFESTPQPKFLGFGSGDPEHPAFLDETVLNVVRTDPGKYMVGLHTVMADSSIQAYYPGGLMPIRIPGDAVSRAWLKFEEGLRWSGFPIGRGTCCLDIGASPGGGSQVLLSRGAKVLGVDPAEMAPVVLSNPNFTHIRGRINQTKRSLYKDVRWVISDMNVAPNYTFDVLEELVSRRDTNIHGMLFTLKLFQWKLADELPKARKWFDRWLFDEVRIKQLAFNRQEVMVAARKSRTKN